MLAAKIEAYGQKKDDLKALKKGKASKGSKKRRRQDHTQASDEEVGGWVRYSFSSCTTCLCIHSFSWVLSHAFIYTSMHLFTTATSG